MHINSNMEFISYRYNAANGLHTRRNSGFTCQPKIWRHYGNLPAARLQELWGTPLHKHSSVLGTQEHSCFLSCFNLRLTSLICRWFSSMRVSTCWSNPDQEVTSQTVMHLPHHTRYNAACPLLRNHEGPQIRVSYWNSKCSVRALNSLFSLAS